MRWLLPLTCVLLLVGCKTHETKPKGSPRAKNPDAWTLGRLVAKVQGCEEAYEANIRQADEIERKEGSLVASRFRIQADISKFDPADVLGIDGLRVLCNQRYGTDVTASSLLRLRGELCAAKGLTIDQANEMDIEDVADELKP